VISSFELQTITIVNCKPHRLLDSSIFGYNGATFCSPTLNFDGATFCSPTLGFDGTTFCSPSLGCNGLTFCFPIIDFDEATFFFELPNHHHLFSVSATPTLQHHVQTQRRR
jgi:hypothetical protein